MTQKLKFVAVLNSEKAKGKKLRLFNNIIEMVRKNHDIEVFKTESKDQAMALFRELSEKKFDRLIVGGGDGSINFAINEMISNKLSDKLLAYIPMGTANILQVETKIKKETHEIYNLLVSNKYKKINLGKVNDKYFFLMTGLGFDSKIIESIDENIKKKFGKLIFIYKSLLHFLLLKNKKFKISIDNEEMLVDWILCTNSKYYAGPYSITNDTNIFDKNIVIYIFKDLTRLKILHFVWLVLTKGDLSSAKSILKKNLGTLEITLNNNDHVSHVDGEICDYMKILKIRKTDQIIKLLVP